jgi:RecB family exonuclease
MPEKEIWKLLELLNEYDSKSWWKETDEWIDNIWKIYEFHSELQIISKKYGFIQRLVEQDKIRDDGIKPRTDLVKEITIVDYDTGKAIWWKNKYSETEQLLMYLAISEQPINLLISILK